MSTCGLSIVAPAHDEAENLAPLVSEVEAAGRRLAAALGDGFEFIIVDDGSTDGSAEILQDLQAGRPWLRILSMDATPPGRGHGQSAAFHAGFRAARGRLVATLDADLQNDPADLEAMLDLMRRTGADVVQGDRSQDRRDGLVRRVGSVVGRLFRRWLLADTIRDTGCSLRLMRREVALGLPLEFRGVHRFIPGMVRAMGGEVVEMAVHHRPRHAGTSKYGMGIRQRAIPGLIDCLAIRWMRSRRRPVAGTEFVRPEAEPAGTAGMREAAVDARRPMVELAHACAAIPVRGVTGVAT